MSGKKEDIQNWRIAVTTRKKKKDYVYKDDYDESWRDVYQALCGTEISADSVQATVGAPLYKKGEFIGLMLKLSQPAGGLSLVRHESWRQLRLDKTVSLGYSFGNDDYSVSYSFTISLEKA